MKRTDSLDSLNSTDSMNIMDSMNYLKSSISKIAGIGPKKAECLMRLGIHDIYDLLNYFPYKYKDRKKVCNLGDAPLDKPVLVTGVLLRKQHKPIGYSRKIIECSFRSGTSAFSNEASTFSVAFFGMPYLYNNLQIGSEYAIFGKLKHQYGRYSFTNPEICLRGSDKDIRGYVPVYHLTQGITNNDLNKWLRGLLQNPDNNNGIDNIRDFLEQELLDKNKLCDIRFALSQAHFPSSNEAYKIARARIIYDRLLIYQIAVNRNRKSLDNGNSSILADADVGNIDKNNAGNVSVNADAGVGDIDKSNEKDVLAPFLAILPFELTEGQLEAIEDIRRDLISPKAMNRLIQGDVGCGKTVVSEAGMYLTVRAGYQSAMMAPTEILARQHHSKIKADFEKLGYSVGLLTSKMSAKDRRELLSKLEEGELDILIGTHALIQDDVVFNKLGLVITDEQHRFGVNQRKNLVKKGSLTNVMVMSATPIPRTLAATVYGDMDFSIIKSRPANRKSIITRAVGPSSREIAYNSVREELKKGNRAYVVAPSIESDNDELESVEALYNEMKSKFSDYRIGFLHGRLDKDEKERIMLDFASGRIQLLVSTVVIEVGIDVPSASIIVIENSERFGLAQLHQLRGRVGRSDVQSYCYLVNYSNSETAVERARIMCETNDGFVISEKDFELRGPGDLAGTVQHGALGSEIISLCSHTELLKMATEDARRIIDSDYSLIDREYLDFVLAKYCDTDNSEII